MKDIRKFIEDNASVYPKVEYLIFDSEKLEITTKNLADSKLDDLNDAELGFLYGYVGKGQGEKLRDLLSYATNQPEEFVHSIPTGYLSVVQDDVRAKISDSIDVYRANPTTENFFAVLKLHDDFVLTQKGSNLALEQRMPKNNLQAVKKTLDENPNLKITSADDDSVYLGEVGDKAKEYPVVPYDEVMVAVKEVLGEEVEDGPYFIVEEKSGYFVGIKDEDGVKADVVKVLEPFGFEDEDVRLVADNMIVGFIPSSTYPIHEVSYKLSVEDWLMLCEVADEQGYLLSMMGVYDKETGRKIEFSTKSELLSALGQSGLC